MCTTSRDSAASSIARCFRCRPHSSLHRRRWAVLLVYSSSEYVRTVRPLMWRTLQLVMHEGSRWRSGCTICGSIGAFALAAKLSKVRTVCPCSRVMRLVRGIYTCTRLVVQEPIAFCIHTCLFQTPVWSSSVQNERHIARLRPLYRTNAGLSWVRTPDSAREAPQA